MSIVEGFASLLGVLWECDAASIKVDRAPVPKWPDDRIREAQKAIAEVRSPEDCIREALAMVDGTSTESADNAPDFTPAESAMVRKMLGMPPRPTPPAPPAPLNRRQRRARFALYKKAVKRGAKPVV